MNTITEWIVEQGIASHGKQAWNIFNGLKLDEKVNGVHLTREQQEERCRLYRKFRPKGSKDVTSKEAFELVLRAAEHHTVMAELEEGKNAVPDKP